MRECELQELLGIAGALDDRSKRGVDPRLPHGASLASSFRIFLPQRPSWSDIIHGVFWFINWRWRIKSSHAEVFNARPSNHYTNVTSVTSARHSALKPLSVQRLGGGQTSCRPFFLTV
uniref:Uncharacterized protein n=1 Tax=Opuntia streptacantha TaxID=393608 RepID=A0A7C8ZP89_OPUST